MLDLTNNFLFLFCVKAMGLYLIFVVIKIIIFREATNFNKKIRPVQNTKNKKIAASKNTTATKINFAAEIEKELKKREQLKKDYREFLK